MSIQVGVMGEMCNQGRGKDVSKGGGRGEGVFLMGLSLNQGLFLLSF